MVFGGFQICNFEGNAWKSPKIIQLKLVVQGSRDIFIFIICVWPNGIIFHLHLDFFQEKGEHFPYFSPRFGFFVMFLVAII